MNKPLFALVVLLNITGFLFLVLFSQPVLISQAIFNHGDILKNLNATSLISFLAIFVLPLVFSILLLFSYNPVNPSKRLLLGCAVGAFTLSGFLFLIESVGCIPFDTLPAACNPRLFLITPSFIPLYAAMQIFLTYCLVLISGRALFKLVYFVFLIIIAIAWGIIYFTGVSCGISDGAKSQCYSTIAYYKNDSSLCEKIPLENPRSACFSSLGILNKDPLLCERASISESRDACYFSIGQKNQNTASCDLIVDASKKEACFSLMWENANDTSICDKLTDFSYKNTCLAIVAKKTKDVSFCLRISEAGGDADKCYFNVAEDVRNAAVCEKIQSSYVRNLCYKDIAYFTDNPKLCEGILDDGSRKSCYGQFK